MEKKWKVNKCGLLDSGLLNGTDYEKLDFENADDLANGSKGIMRLYVYNMEKKEYRYEYYFVKIVKNGYYGKLCNHTFKMQILQVLNGKHRQVGDIITKNGKILYHNYFEIRKATTYNRSCKHRQKRQFLGTELCIN